MLGRCARLGPAPSGDLIQCETATPSIGDRADVNGKEENGASTDKSNEKDAEKPVEADESKVAAASADDGKEFGFFPEPLDFSASGIKVSTLSGLDEKVSTVSETGVMQNGWLYASNGSRTFNLPKTHMIEYPGAESDEQVHFLVWSLGFFTGMRLTSSASGFLDATPVEPNKLCDFKLATNDLAVAVGGADEFWKRYKVNPKISKAIMGVVHSLFLSQTPSLMDFERFSYLKTAFDAFHWAHSTIYSEDPQATTHSKRIKRLCEVYGMEVPVWADFERMDPAMPETSDTFHEALLFDERWGFSVNGNESAPNKQYWHLYEEMERLLCRLLFSVMGMSPFVKSPYSSAPLADRQVKQIHLTMEEVTRFQEKPPARAAESLFPTTGHEPTVVHEPA